MPWERLKADQADLNALICNGGICPVGIPFEHVDFETTRDAFETNVIGNMRLAQRCLPSRSRSVIVQRRRVSPH
jgi:NAD(P)-dependent dehydrogenase (short-subunit alcohol dehydrogenase family)